MFIQLPVTSSEAAGLVSISANADEETVEILVEHGLQKHYGQSVIAWRERKATLRKDVDIWREDELRNVKEANAKQEQSIHAMTERAILGKFLDKFPYAFLFDQNQFQD